MGARRRAAGVILVTLLLSGCASTREPRPEPFPRVGSSRGAIGAGPSVFPSGEAIAQSARALVGLPYAPGGTGPDRFDCSGLVQFVFGRAGVALPRSVAEQMTIGARVSRKKIAPGDLLFFRIDGSKPTHVAIAIGEDAFVHAPNARGQVRVDRLSAGYWLRRFELAKRVIADP